MDRLKSNGQNYQYRNINDKYSKHIEQLKSLATSLSTIIDKYKLYHIITDIDMTINNIKGEKNSSKLKNTIFKLIYILINTKKPQIHKILFFTISGIYKDNQHSNMHNILNDIILMMTDSKNELIKLTVIEMQLQKLLPLSITSYFMSINSHDHIPTYLFFILKHDISNDQIYNFYAANIHNYQKIKNIQKYLLRYFYRKQVESNKLNKTETNITETKFIILISTNIFNNKVDLFDTHYYRYSKEFFIQLIDINVDHQMDFPDQDININRDSYLKAFHLALWLTFILPNSYYFFNYNMLNPYKDFKEELAVLLKNMISFGNIKILLNKSLDNTKNQELSLNKLIEIHLNLIIKNLHEQILAVKPNNYKLKTMCQIYAYFRYCTCLYLKNQNIPYTPYGFIDNLSIALGKNAYDIYSSEVMQYMKTVIQEILHDTQNNILFESLYCDEILQPINDHQTINDQNKVIKLKHFR